MPAILIVATDPTTVDALRRILSDVTAKRLAEVIVARDLPDARYVALTRNLLTAFVDLQLPYCALILRRIKKVAPEARAVAVRSTVRPADVRSIVDEALAAWRQGRER